MIASIEVFDTLKYSVEHLFDNEINSLLVEKFETSPNARGLEIYLRHCAVSDEVEHLSRTYLIKDRVTEELAGYFSLRTGLITRPVSGSSFDSVPAIELSNFAMDCNYKARHTGEMQHLGAYVFKYFVVPTVKAVAELIGVNSLYIYALPSGRLMEHYEKMGFLRLPPDEEMFVHNHVKPKYDNGCVFMYQVLSLKNRCYS
ncbi:hypothetical protein [Fibrobacter sp. UWEL]|uniref:hypothetical protein n=1 Tax=Fibrobacter sp. UWEL TaxID=1896209 RepID=UPI00091316F6|nr:hypothetical protein [Fibrobacter sp. UWEL]SHL22658.1 hypothetical protein SAMN05720468_11812 [Fibrobacter sp. UWEL]